MPVATKVEIMPWKAECSVGIKQIDEQHQRLVRLLNELHQAMYEGKSREVMAGVLSQLVVDYTKGHFASEERLMQGYLYPGYAAHKAEHDQLTKTVLKFQQELTAGKVVMSIDLLEFLKNWLREHTMGTDQQYSPFLKSKGVS
jgi:hemerythrin